MHMTRKAIGTRLRVALGAAAAALLAACSTEDILTVTDPDIINPSDVSSPDGADALRVGALSRFIGATTGYNGGSSGETLWLYSGLLADEWQTGDTFAQRIETDARHVIDSNNNIANGYLYAHKARVSAAQAIRALAEFAPTAPAWQTAELYFVEGYLENMLAEHFCNGIAFADVIGGQEVYGAQMTGEQVYALALAHVDSGLAVIGAGTTAQENKVRNALRVTRGRILVNLARFTDAAAAVSAVPTSFAYEHQHSQTTRTNTIGEMNNVGRRYTVGDNEGGNGLPFVSANDPRLPTCTGNAPVAANRCQQRGFTTSNTPFNTTNAVPLRVQLRWTSGGQAGSTAAQNSPDTVTNGIEARLIEAEAQMRAGNFAGAGGTLVILNNLRTASVGGVAGLAPLTDPGTAAAQQNLFFREKAFWLYSRGTRLGDLRRLIRQYGRSSESVFPTGVFAEGGNYGPDVNLVLPQQEQNNPSFHGCLDRNA
ncbi:MAG TPA: hypothetical protein VF541_04690 [Longimicrobium sp.]|jgi:hypothetical protein